MPPPISAPRRVARKTGSFLLTPPPRFVVLLVVEPGRRVEGALLRLFDEAAALRDLRRIVRESYFIVKQLAARVSEQLLQLRHAPDHRPRAVAPLTPAPPR